MSTRVFEAHPDWMLGNLGHPPLTTEQIRAVVQQLTYKPGWGFALAVRECTKEGCIAHVLTSFPSSRDEPWSVPFVYCVNGLVYSEAQLIHGIGQAIMDIEMHEFKEWFRHAGEFVNDPHPPNGNFFLRS